MRFYLLLFAISVCACNTNNSVSTNNSKETAGDADFIRTTNYSVFPTELTDQIIHAEKLSKDLYNEAYDILLNKITTVIIRTKNRFVNTVIDSYKDSVVSENIISAEETDSLFRSDLAKCFYNLIVTENNFVINKIDDKNSEMRLTLEINTDEVIRLYLKNGDIIFPVSGKSISDAQKTQQTIDSFKKLFLEELERFENENQNSGEVKYQR